MEDSPVFQCETSVSVFSASCEWTLRHWKLAIKEGSNEAIDSPTFHAAELPHIQWLVRLWPNRRYGGGQAAQMDVALLVDRSDLIHSTEMTCTLWSLNPGETERTLVGSIKRIDYWGLSSRIGARPEDVTGRDLIIECSVRHSLKASVSGVAQMETFGTDAPRVSRAKMEAEERRNALESFGALLTDERFADVILRLDETSWPAHRAVLAQRSPVLCAMFVLPLSEQQRQEVHLTEDEGVDTAAWNDFLHFLYTGIAPELDHHCISLLKLADKYEVPGLRTLSAMAIGEQLTNESLPHALLLAFLHNATELRETCLRFMRAAGPEVYATAGWRQLMTEWPDVVVDALKATAPQPKVVDSKNKCEASSNRIRITFSTDALPKFHLCFPNDAGQFLLSVEDEDVEARDFACTPSPNTNDDAYISA